MEIKEVYIDMSSKNVQSVSLAYLIIIPHKLANKNIKFSQTNSIKAFYCNLELKSNNFLDFMLR